MHPANPTIRPSQSADIEAIKALTVSAFQGVTLEENVEALIGLAAGHDWRWRKARHIDEDIARCPEGVFVAVHQGKIVGYITTQIDAEAGRGRIPNLAVDEAYRGHGLGRRLIQTAVDFLQTRGLEYVMIETMAQNAAGNHLYPDCGFTEVARQVHFAMRLRPSATSSPIPATNNRAGE